MDTTSPLLSLGDYFKISHLLICIIKTISYKHHIKTTTKKRHYFNQLMKLMVYNCSIKYFYSCTQCKDAFNKYYIVRGTDLNLLIH